MTDDRLFDMEGIPEVPLLREPRARRGAAAGSARDARFLNDYPPEWDRCTTCKGRGVVPVGEQAVGPVVFEQQITCPDCLGMGSLKARVRFEAGHRCVRCQHPYIPKGDAKMMRDARMLLSVHASGLHDCEKCEGTGGVLAIVGNLVVEDVPEGGLIEFDLEGSGGRITCLECKGTGKRWSPWSACDESCAHGGPIRVRTPDWNEVDADGFRGVGDGWVEDTAKHIDREPGAYLRDGHEVEAIWRILTVHHLDGDKANLRWWNLASLCQRCHLEVQAKVVMERVYPHEHSEWFRPYVAGYYAWVYNGEELTREETMDRLDELLALERAA